MTPIESFRAHEPKPTEEPGFFRANLPDAVHLGLRELVTATGLPMRSFLLAAHCLTLQAITSTSTVVTGLVVDGIGIVPVTLDRPTGSWLDSVRSTRIHEHPYGGNLESVFSYCPDVLPTGLNSGGAVLVHAADLGTGVELRLNTGLPGVTRSQLVQLGQTFIAVLTRMIDEPHRAADFDFLATPPITAIRPAPLVDVVTRIRRQAAARPDAPAVTMDEVRWSYGELDQVSRTVAASLARTGASRGAAIGVALARSPEMIATVLGILRAGLVCVPLDVSYPEQRLALILDTSRPHRVIVDPRYAHLVRDRELALPVAEVLAGEPGDDDLTPDLAELACILFTSGSTGRPKGVELTHRMWANYVQWQLRVPSGLPGRSTLQFAPLSFDMAFQEILSTLAGGGELRLVSEQVRRDPPALLRLLDRYAVQRVLLPFVALQQLAEASCDLGLTPGALRVVISSGEQLRVTEHVRTFCSKLPGLLLENQYGPTETHQVTYHSLTGDPALFPELPPIGTPLDGVEVLLLDGDLVPVPAGGTGEIYLGGDCLARGYHRAPELTEKSFVPHPRRPRERLYRTGDLGRVLPSGEIVWLGRADNQVKVRGHRIEIAEVELAVLRQGAHQPGLSAAAVVARGDSDVHLVAFLRGDPSQVDLAQLRAGLQAELPAHMVPARFAWLDSFPLTASGKRDDSALRAMPVPAPSIASAVETGSPAVPLDESERAVAGLFTELLGVAGVGPEDDFFVLGGSSLTAMRLVTRIEKLYDVSIPLTTLLDTPTVSALAELLRDRVGPRASDPLVPIRTGEGRTPLFLAHPLNGQVLCYLALSRKLPQDQPVYGLRTDSGTPSWSNLQQLAAHHLAAVRRVQPHGPCALGGWSFGGFVAYEMARQLRETDPGTAVELYLFDSITLSRRQNTAATDNALNEFWRWQQQHEDDPTDSFPLVEAHWRALLDYHPTTTDLDITLFRAGGPIPDSLKPLHDAAGILRDDPSNGWRDWTTGVVNVVDVPGDHLSLLDDPHVDAVADVIARLGSNR